MKTFGFPQAIKALEGFAVDHAIAEHEALNVLATKLAEWAVAEHPWENDRPHTEATIRAYVSEVTATHSTVKLVADLDAGLWLELAMNGKWSWLWPVIMRHSDEIREILAGIGAISTAPARSSDLQGQYEAAQDAFRAKRG